MQEQDVKRQYEAKLAEYHEMMHKGAWRIAWGFFFALVGVLPLMYVWVYMVGAKAWEHTFFHAPSVMWMAAPLNLGIVIFFVFRLYKQNLELDARKQALVREINALKAQLPEEPNGPSEPNPEPDYDSFQH